MNLEDYKDIFEPFERLVEIEILGEKRAVPENNSLLRCFQYLSIETISFGDFCWNGDCLNCQVWIKNGDREKGIIACRTKVQEGMQIVRLSKEIDLKSRESRVEGQESRGESQESRVKSKEWRVE